MKLGRRGRHEESPKLDASPKVDALKTPLSARVLERLDKVRDSAAPEELRLRWMKVVRKIGLTRSGQIAIVVAIILWIFARIVGGLPVFLIAYGALMLVGLSYLL